MEIDCSAYGQLRVSNKLKKQGIIISPGGVRCIWPRHDLNNIKQRLHALEANMAQERLFLTERQLQALEKAKRPMESLILPTPVILAVRALTMWISKK